MRGEVNRFGRREGVGGIKGWHLGEKEEEEDRLGKCRMDIGEMYY